ncbi:unnamed protein product [Amoebophrya sp. A120]|nr:unnamed protein product [Amoebophrya sp. A120]|eukprot:GSA120T00010089001.1
MYLASGENVDANSDTSDSSDVEDSEAIAASRRLQSAPPMQFMYERRSEFESPQNFRTPDETKNSSSGGTASSPGTSKKKSNNNSPSKKNNLSKTPQSGGPTVGGNGSRGGNNGRKLSTQHESDDEDESEQEELVRHTAPMTYANPQRTTPKSFSGHLEGGINAARQKAKSEYRHPGAPAGATAAQGGGSSTPSSKKNKQNAQSTSYQLSSPPRQDRGIVSMPSEDHAGVYSLDGHGTAATMSMPPGMMMKMSRAGGVAQDKSTPNKSTAITPTSGKKKVNQKQSTSPVVTKAGAGSATTSSPSKMGNKKNNKQLQGTTLTSMQPTSYNSASTGAGERKESDESVGSFLRQESRQDSEIIIPGRKMYSEFFPGRVKPVTEGHPKHQQQLTRQQRAERRPSRKVPGEPGKLSPGGKIKIKPGAQQVSSTTSSDDTANQRATVATMGGGHDPNRRTTMGGAVNKFRQQLEEQLGKVNNDGESTTKSKKSTDSLSRTVSGAKKKSSASRSTRNNSRFSDNPPPPPAFQPPVDMDPPLFRMNSINPTGVVIAPGELDYPATSIPTVLVPIDIANQPKVLMPIDNNGTYTEAVPVLMSSDFATPTTPINAAASPFIPHTTGTPQLLPFATPTSSGPHAINTGGGTSTTTPAFSLVSGGGGMNAAAAEFTPQSGANNNAILGNVNASMLSGGNMDLQMDDTSTANITDGSGWVANNTSFNSQSKTGSAYNNNKGGKMMNRSSGGKGNYNNQNAMGDGGQPGSWINNNSNDNYGNNYWGGNAANQDQQRGSGNNQYTAYKGSGNYEYDPNVDPGSYSASYMETNNPQGGPLNTKGTSTTNGYNNSYAAGGGATSSSQQNAGAGGGKKGYNYSGQKQPRNKYGHLVVQNQDQRQNQNLQRDTTSSADLNAAQMYSVFSPGTGGFHRSYSAFNKNQKDYVQGADGQYYPQNNYMGGGGDDAGSSWGAGYQHPQGNYNANWYGGTTNSSYNQYGNPNQPGLHNKGYGKHQQQGKNYPASNQLAVPPSAATKPRASSSSSATTAQLTNKQLSHGTADTPTRRRKHHAPKLSKAKKLERLAHVAWHAEATSMGWLDEDTMKFVKHDAFHGRLSALSENHVRQHGVHRYCVSFHQVHHKALSNADGMGFVFSSLLPCTKNIQKIKSIFLNKKGQIMIRREKELNKCIIPLETDDPNAHTTAEGHEKSKHSAAIVDHETKSSSSADGEDHRKNAPSTSSDTGRAIPWKENTRLHMQIDLDNYKVSFWLEEKYEEDTDEYHATDVPVPEDAVLFDAIQMYLMQYIVLHQIQTDKWDNHVFDAIQICSTDKLKFIHTHQITVDYRSYFDLEQDDLSQGFLTIVLKSAGAGARFVSYDNLTPKPELPADPQHDIEELTTPTVSSNLGNKTPSGAAGAENKKKKTRRNKKKNAAANSAGNSPTNGAVNKDDEDENTKPTDHATFLGEVSGEVIEQLEDRLLTQSKSTRKKKTTSAGGGGPKTAGAPAAAGSTTSSVSVSKSSPSKKPSEAATLLDQSPGSGSTADSRTADA